MMTQTVLPFKLGVTDERITAHAGLALFGEFVKALDVAVMVDRELPGPGSAAGYSPSRYVVPLLLMQHGGGRHLEDLRVVRDDAGLRSVVELSEFPSSDAAGDWLRRMGMGVGLLGFSSVNREVVRRGLEGDGLVSYTLDVDATQIEAEKYDAKWTYKGSRGYMPMVGHLAENGLVLGDEFREGNDSPNARNLEFITHCAKQMPEGKRIGALRSDSAAYQAGIINWCEKEGVKFAIGADLDSAVVDVIRGIPEKEWQKWRDGEVAETAHCMNSTRKAFRLVVVRRPKQGDLFEPGAHPYRYHVVASNREETAEETMEWYCQRGEASENRIKELKIGFGMESMPCGSFSANAVWFRIGVLAYNLFVLFKQKALAPGWHRHQVRTVRWRLYQTAGKVVRHAGALYLKVSSSVMGIFEQIRTRCAMVSERSRTVVAAPA